MNPDDIPWAARDTAPLWDTPEYWERKAAREKLLLARQRAQKDRPRRVRRFKLAQKSKRRNRR